MSDAELETQITQIIEAIEAKNKGFPVDEDALRRDLNRLGPARIQELHEQLTSRPGFVWL